MYIETPGTPTLALPNYAVKGAKSGLDTRMTPVWNWTIHEETKPGIYFRVKDVECQGRFRHDSYRWELMNKDSSFVTIDIRSHNMVRLDDAIGLQQWTNGSRYVKYDMLHSIKITLIDFYTNSYDDWIVTFASNGKVKFGGNLDPKTEQVTGQCLRENVTGQEIPWFW